MRIFEKIVGMLAGSEGFGGVSSLSMNASIPEKNLKFPDN